MLESRGLIEAITRGCLAHLISYGGAPGFQRAVASPLPHRVPPMATEGYPPQEVHSISAERGAVKSEGMAPENRKIQQN